MSLNQSRSEKNDSQYRKPGGGGGRSGSNSGAQHRPFNGGRGGRGAPGPTSGPPPNRSYKKVNNDQGGQSRPNPGFVNAADPRAASGGRSVENGGHAQPALQAVPRAPVPAPAPAPAAVAKQADSLPQKTSRPLPRPPPSQSASTNANSGDGPKGFSLQFGSISAGYLHAVQVPARTNSAPPNLDEQKRDQVLRDASRAVPAAPLPFSYRQDSSTKTDVSTEKSVSRETSTEPQAKRDDLVGVKYPPKQAPKPSPPPPKTGLSTLSQFHQPAPATLMQYGVPNPRVQSQGTPSTSLQMLTVGIGYPTAKVVDRSGVPARSDRRGNGIMEADRWNKQPGPFPPAQDPRMDFFHGNDALGFQGARGPSHGVLRTRPQFPVQHVGGILAGPMHSLGFQGGQRNNSDADRWQRGSNFNKGLIHKAERKYEVGKVTDEEQAKQRKLKGILNKLTPQNFERLFEQVKEVNIDNVTTLTGVIDQIFDKALTELTFCEMYADFCQHLASELPDLNVNNEKITFRRLLLNKCQEEFERGEREEQEANNADGEDGSEQSEAVREEKRVKARKRMLGNIRLIGELYKKRMLTERVMHECIKKLLGEYQNPDEENIEALCKLMSTIGEMIDHSKAKDHMDAYFDIMGQLSNNKMLSSRVRFMLMDAIDLRKNKWQERRKLERL